MKKFMENVKSQVHEYSGIPFWSLNDKLKEEELRRQINVMHEIGFRGFFMHARGGLETEFLSEEWFKCINICVDEAKKLGMEAWSYDENGWPSGFAGGKLLTDKANWATYLRYEFSEEYPEGENLLGVYVLKDHKCQQVGEKQSDIEQYVAIYQEWDSSYVDTMNPEITKKFLQEIHEQYKAKVGISENMPGFFTDEPQYYRWATPWSELLPEEFENRYGYSIFTLLPALFLDFEGAEEFRWDYYKLCHELFIHGFIKIVYEWCEENGCLLTGHTIEETCLHTQMWCSGGVMPFYEYEHIPGMDYLGRELDTDIAPRQLGSVCAQLGKKQVLSEMFAACGWDVTPKELKRIAELQYVNGVNMMCQHLYPYSERGERKRDWPCHYSEHLPWQKSFSDFNQYFSNLGCLLAQGQEKVKVLVIHPIHSAYLTYKRKEDAESVKELQEDLYALNSLLSDRQIPYHFGDENMMAEMAHVENGQMCVGLCKYEYIVIPAMDSLDASTAALLEEYQKQGGHLYLFEKKPTRVNGRKADLKWLSSNCVLEDIQKEVDVLIRKEGNIVPQLRQSTREADGNRLFYLVNLSEKEITDVEITIKNCRNLYKIDLYTLEHVPVKIRKDEHGDGHLRLNFENSQAWMFAETSDLDEAEPEKDALNVSNGNIADYCLADRGNIVLDKPFKLCEPVKNMFTLDYVELSYDGVHFEKARQILLARDILLRKRYEGDLYLKYSFDVTELPNEMKVAIETMRHQEVWVNGETVTVDGEWWFDRSIRTKDILSYVKEGRNEILMKISYYQRDYVYYVLYGGVSESLRNSLYFDTEIEAIYLLGDFCVNMDQMKITQEENDAICYTGEFSIVRQKETLDLSNIVTDGYPFFAGGIEVETIYNYLQENETELYVNGHFAVCDVLVNNIFAGRLLFENHLNLKKYLHTGENKISLRLYNSNRNLLGPHHFKTAEPLFTSPDILSLESQWDGEECDSFEERYAFVRFGIDLE